MTLRALRDEALVDHADVGTGAASDVDESRPQDPGVDLVHRVIVALAAIGILGPAFATWAGIVMVHLTGVASVLLSAGALVLITSAMVAKTTRQLRVVEGCLLVLGLVALSAWATAVVAANPSYGTDEAAFEQYAGHLLLSGFNPYAHSLLPALREFRVPIQYATYTTSGGVVSSLGYPALPVLLVIPFMWITGGVQAVPVMNTVALAVSMVVAFFVLPRKYRALSVLCVVGLPILFGYAVAGVNVILAIPLLLVVAWRFTEIGAGGKLARRGVAQAICFGLAVSVQQMAWFVVPFVLLAVFLSRKNELGCRDALWVTARFCGIALGVFGVVNVAFFVAGPGAWLRGVLEPLVQHAIPYGQGLIDLPVFAGVGGGNLALFTYAALAVVFGLLVCLAAFFGSMWRASFVLPSLALFFPTRSLAEYWMTLVLVWLVSFFAAVPERSATPSRSAKHRWRRRWGPLGLLALVGGAFAPSIALLSLAVASAPPLALKVVGIRTNGQYERVWELTVRVTNDSGRTLEPHFATNSIGQMTPFWHRLHGPARLPPAHSARYLLAAPNVGAMPGITQPFQLDAVTNVPETISVTHDIVTEPYDAWIYQSDVNQVLRSGQSTTLTVQLRSPLGGRVHKANVVVALGQVIYTQTQLVAGEARINHAAEGQSPVTARTNARGEATFHIADTSPQGQPIYFQAWTVSRSGYPFGYSEIVDILWTKK
ncbi:MAG: hypothetical protein M0Z95_07620 [Actinomycetota bacterium]|nr:hypothetical protein [Actinomycetota bacterium]